MRNLSNSSSEILKHHYRWVNFQAAALALHECLQTAALSASFSYLTWGNGSYRSKAAQRGLQERSSEAVARSAAAEAFNILQHPCNPFMHAVPKVLSEQHGQSQLRLEPLPQTRIFGLLVASTARLVQAGLEHFAAGNILLACLPDCLLQLVLACVISARWSI